MVDGEIWEEELGEEEADGVEVLLQDHGMAHRGWAAGGLRRQ